MPTAFIKVLLIDGDPAFARRLRGLLQESKPVTFELHCETTLEAGLASLDQLVPDIVLLDVSLTVGNWANTVARIQSRPEHLPVIVLGSLDDETAALQAVHEGAQDYLVKSEVSRQTIIRDIRYSIEREQSERALAQAEAKFRSIFENTSEGIFQTTADGHYLSANPALARIYGFPSTTEMIASLTNISNQLYVHPQRREEFVRLMEEHDVVRGFDSQVYRRDRSVIWITENVRAVRDARHQLLYYEGTVEDITDRKRAEEEVRNSEALYHSLVENLPQFIFRKDLEGRFTFANQRFCQTLGKSLEEILGRTDFDFFPDDLARKYQEDDSQVIQSGQMKEIIEQYQPAKGDPLFITVVKTPLHDATGRIIGLQGIFWDVTEKKRAEEGLQKTTAALARSQQELQAKNAELEEDLRMAREIQQAILPQQYPNFPRAAEASASALRFCHRYVPAGSVGGDFFSIVALSDSKAGIFICDVMGHGVRSALVTAIVRTLVEELTPIAADAGQLLSRINKEIRVILKQSGTVLFTTAFYGVLDLETHRLTYANAGHPRPFLIRPGAGEVDILPPPDGRGAPALGLIDNTTYRTAECAIAPGDSLMLFTDGLFDVEGPNQDAYDARWLQGRVRELLRKPLPEVFDAVLTQLKAASPGGVLADDVCVVGVEVMR